MANDDFFDALDAAEAAQVVVGKKILESKEQKRVRYWYEEGYVPGNEKDSDDEEEKNDDDKQGDGEQADEAHEAESDADSSASSTKYEEVKIGSGIKHGGRKVRWGGVHGKLALTDASSTALARFDEVMDELLLPGGETRARGSDDPGLSEVSAIVLAQMPPEGRCWSYSYSSQLAIEDVRLEEGYEATRERFAIEDGSENAQVRSEEEPAMAHWAKVHERAKKQAREELVQEIKKEEAKKRSIERGAREQLPGTRRPLPLSQAFQERREEHGAKKVEAPRPSGRSMLPCSLSSSSSSQPADSSKELRQQNRLAVGQSQNWTLRKAPGQQFLRESVLKPQPVAAPEDDGMQPEFRIPKRHMPKFVKR